MYKNVYYSTSLAAEVTYRVSTLRSDVNEMHDRRRLLSGLGLSDETFLYFISIKTSRCFYDAELAWIQCVPLLIPRIMVQSAYWGLLYKMFRLNGLSVIIEKRGKRTILYNKRIIRLNGTFYTTDPRLSFVGGNFEQSFSPAWVVVDDVVVIVVAVVVVVVVVVVGEHS